MTNVVLPSNDENAIIFAQKQADKRHNVYFIYSKVLAASPVPGANGEKGDKTMTYFTRISAQVYVTLSDFELLAEIVPRLLKEYAENNRCVK
jgi:transcriptional regulator